MPRPRKILFLITDLDLGGSPLMLQSLATGLAGLNRDATRSPLFDVHVCSLAPLPPDSPIPQTLRAANSPVHSLNLADISPRAAAAGLAAYRKLLAEIDPDLVYSILIHANALATLGKQTTRHRHKLVHAIHTLQPEPRWHWTLQGAIAQTADAIIAPSQAILDRIATFGPFQRGVVIPNGIDVDRFASAIPWPLPPADENPGPIPTAATGGGKREAQGGQNKAQGRRRGGRTRLGVGWEGAFFRLGYVGRFDPVKRLDVLLTSLTHLPIGAYELFFVGYGEQENQLRQLAISLHLAPFVHFPGPTREPERWYKTFDIHVLPSPVEGFGLTLVESLAAGVPVVAVDTPATAAIVRKNVDGIRISSLSASSLAEAIQEVARWIDSHQWNPAPSRAWVGEHFSAEAMLGRHAEILEKILVD